MAGRMKHDGLNGDREEAAALTSKLQRRLNQVFESSADEAANLDAVISWLAGMLEKGLTRVYTVNLGECFQVKHHPALVERLRRRTGDPNLAALLESTLETLVAQHPRERDAVASLVSTIALEDIDHLVKQARAVGRDQATVHLTGTRWGDALVILADQGASSEWLMRATQRRVAEALAKLGVYPTAAETQSLDLAQGDTLQLFGFDFRAAIDRRGSLHIQYQRVARVAPTLHVDPPRRPAVGRYFAGARWFTWLQHASHNWLGFARLLRAELAQFCRSAYGDLASIKVGWRHLPIALYPVLAIVAGWDSPAAWACVGAVVMANWRSLPVAGAFAWRNRSEVAAATGGMAFLIYSFLGVSSLYRNRSREDPAPHMPPGFYLGRYRPSWLTDESVHYGLYVPPHFAREKGPFPLIVFLHGWGERTEDSFLAAGVAPAIVSRFGEQTRNGRFDFVVFFPLDTTALWQMGAGPIEGAMQALGHVSQRHRIDRRRVYLTGHSNGGNGVWNLAEAWPDEWAAVAPVSAFIDPDVNKVRHLPTWIFHAAKDTRAPVERERALVQRLQVARADVRYTEIPDKRHVIWREVYDSRQLYDWFATKVRR